MDQNHSTTEPLESKDISSGTTVKRPGSVTVLGLGVLILTAINLVRLVLSLRYWSFLASLPGVPPYYLALTGLIWTLAGAILIWGLWKARSWAPKLIQAEALTYALYYWLDLLFLKDHPLSGAGAALRVILPSNWQFSAGVTVICLTYIVWALNRPRVKAYFGLAEAETNLSQVKNGTEDKS
jgi:hypothetical protein